MSSTSELQRTALKAHRNALLEQSKPTIVRNPAQLLETYQKKKRQPPETKSKASAILAQRGCNSIEIERTLQEINLKGSHNVTEEGHHDLESFLSSNYQNIILSTFETVKTTTSDSFHDSFTRRFISDWEVQKRELNEILQGHTIHSWIDQPLGKKMPTSVSSSSSSSFGISDSTVLQSRMSEYLQPIHKRHMSDRPIDLIDEYIALDMKDKSKEDIIRTWQCIKKLTSNLPSDFYKAPLRGGMSSSSSSSSSSLSSSSANSDNSTHYLTNKEDVKTLDDNIKEYSGSLATLNGAKPLVRFQVLLLGKEFEQAIEFLISHDRYKIETVHFALVLYYYRLLRQPENIENRLHALFGEEIKPRGKFLNIRRLVQIYTEPFISASPQACLDYIFMIKDVGDRLDRIKHLILKNTDQLAVLLGNFVFNNSDTVILNYNQKSGYLFSLLKDEAALNRIIVEVAKEARRKGAADVAIILFQLIKDYECVTQILIDELNRSIVDWSQRELVFEKAKKFNTLFERDPLPIPSLTRFNNMLLLAKFFDCYQREQFDEAINIINRHGILPLKKDHIPDKIDIVHNDPEMIKLLPNLLLATADALFQMHNAKMEQAHNRKNIASLNDMKHIEKIKEAISVLTTFAGLLSNKLPIDVVDSVVRLQV